MTAPVATLEARLARLEARAGIEDLMQRYAAAADRKYTALREKRSPSQIAMATEEQAGCFVPDGEWSGGAFGGTLKGHAAIAAFFRQSPWLFTSHHYGSPAFQLDGDTATLRWRLIEIGIRDSDGRVLLLTGTVDQTCRLTPEGWRIATMSFDTLHAISLAETPEALRCLIPTGETFC